MPIAKPEVQPISSVRERLNKVPAFTSELVTVPEWEDVVIEVRSMTVAEKVKLVEAATNADGDIILAAIQPQLVIATAFDPATGDKVFSDTDADFISAQNARPVERLANAGSRLSGITDVDEAIAEGKDGS